MNTVILHVQILTLILTTFSIGVIIYAVIQGRLKLGLVIMALLMLVNLGLFLTERILVKTDIISPPISAIGINIWSVSLHLQLALSGSIAAVLILLNGKVHGTYDK